MPDFVAISPALLKAVLELAGYQVWAEDEFSWTMGRGLTDVPISIPKIGRVVTVDDIRNVLFKAEISDMEYFDLLSRAWESGGEKK